MRLAQAARLQPAARALPAEGSAPIRPTRGPAGPVRRPWEAPRRGAAVRTPLITVGCARSRSRVGLPRSRTARKSSTGPCSALGSIASKPSSSSFVSDSIGSAPSIPSVWTSPASEIDVVSVRAKRLSAIRGPGSSLATNASTAAGWSRCSVISSALPTCRMRVPPGGTPCASRIAARRASLYRDSAVLNASRCPSPAGVAEARGRSRLDFRPDFGSAATVTRQTSRNRPL